MKWLKNSTRSVMMMLSVAMLTFSVNAEETSHSGYKLPSRGKLSTIPSASTPYRMRYVYDCESIPADCMLEAESLFTPWQDVSAPFDYTSWTPVPKLQTTDFSQERDYTISQARYEQKRIQHKETGKYLNDGRPIRHDQDAQRTESRVVTVSYSEWVNDGANHSCGEWSPDPSVMPWGQTYQQSRSCLEPETRDRIYTAEAAELSREIERRNVSSVETRDRTGQEDFIVKTEAGVPTEWADYGTKTCGEWSPEPSTVWDDETFTQSRDCSIEQEREVTYFDYWASGAPNTENRTERETQTRNFSEDQDVAGEKELWSATTDGYSEWEDSGIASYTSWSPSSANQTSNYEQTRTKTQPQTRERHTREVNNRDGSFRNISSVTENQNVSIDESRTVIVTATSWEDTTRTNVANWSPTATNQTTNFSQSRGFTQNQERTWEHRTEGMLMYSRPDSRALTSESESRNVAVSVGDWAYTSNEYDTSAWSPSSANQTANYVQNQTYKRNRARTWTYSVSGSEIHSRSETDVEDLDRDRSVTVTTSNWSDTTRSNVGSWSPLISSQTADFNQSRGYTQNRERTFTHKVGTSTIHSRVEAGSLTSQTESRTISVTASGWSNTTQSGTSGWSPSAASQTSNFVQSQGFTQNQERTWTYKSGATTLDTRTETQALAGQSRSRTVTVSSGNWAYTSGEYNTSAWSPASANQTTNYSQNQTYKRNRARTWTYSVGGSEIHSRSETDVEDLDRDRSVTVTTSNWSDTTRSSVGSWSPLISSQTADFNQSRGYTQNRERTFTHKVGTSTIHSRVEAGSLTSQTESRTIAVTASGWSNTTQSGTSGWSPSAASQTSNFVQSQGFTQNQERTWTYKSGATTLDTRTETQALAGQSRSRTVTVSSGNWAYTSGEYSTSAWSPASANQTVSYTQNQTYKRNRARTWTYSVSGSEIHSRSETGVENLDRNRSVTVTSSGWSDTTRSNVGSWSPIISSQTADFNQSRGYTQNRERTFTHKVGTSTIYSRVDTGSLTSQTESRTIAVTASGWSNTTQSGTSGWSPVAASQTSNFVQSQGFTQNQERTWTYKSGATTLDTRTETQALAGQSRSRTVTVSSGDWAYTGNGYDYATFAPAHGSQTANYTQSRPYKRDRARTWTYTASGSAIHARTQTDTENLTGTRTVYVYTGDWSNTTQEGYSSWSPSTGTRTANFTQSRSFTQNRTRTYTHKVGTTTVHTRAETGSLTGQSESRSVVVSVSGWANTTQSGTTGWSPVPASQTSNFVQSQGYTQNQERTWTYKVGTSTIGTRSETRALSNQSRSRTVTVSAGSWGYTSGAYDYGSYAPAYGNQTANYTQSRPYKRNKARTWTYTASGSQIHSRAESGTESLTQSRTVAVSVSGWSNTTTAAHTAWSPSTGTRTANFTQSRSYTQNRTRTYTHKVGTTTVHTRAETGSLTGQSESRSVVVSVSGWANTTQSGTTGWSPVPASQTSNFVQSQGYTQNQERTWTYKVGTSTIDTRKETRALSNQSRSRTVTVSAGSWGYTSAAYDYGSYAPAYGNQTANYTQSRPYKRNRSRTWIYTASGSQIHSRVENGTQSLTQSRTVTVSIGGWSNTSTSAHTAWSPSTGTRTANFTQSRSYTQNRTRTYTHKVGTTTVHSRVESGSLTGQSESRSVAVSVSGWANTTQSGTTGWSPVPASQTSNFVQSQGYTQNQERTWTYKVGTSTIDTRKETRALSGQSRSRTVTVSAGSWGYTSAAYDYGSYAPAYGNQTANYTQSRPYKRNRSRTWTYTASGSQIHSRVENGTQSLTQSRTVTVSIGGWSNTSTSAHTAWSPSTGTRTANFTQSRSFTQNRTRTYTHKVGTTTVHTRAETGSLTGQSESRSVVVSVSGWANTTQSGTTGWSPVPASQTSNFVQSQGYTQNQERTWTYKVGTSTIDTRKETRALSGQSRSRTVTVSAGSWGYTSAAYDYGSYAPAYGNQTANYTQSRPYKRNRSRTWIYTASGSQIHSRVENGTQSLTQSRTVTVSIGGWSNTSTSAHTAWSPSTGTRTANFTQSRSYTQNRTRTYTHKVGTTTVHSRVESGSLTGQSESRSVAVSVSGWANTTQSGTTGWSPVPASQTSNFVQSQGYTQNQERTWTYKVGTSTIDTRKETRALSGQSRSRTVTVSAGSWGYTSAAYDYGSYSPAYGNQTANYTQSRPYKRNRARTWTYTASGSQIHSRVESGTESLTQSRTVAVSVSGWSNTTTAAHTAWSPSTGTRTANFTQSRSYTQNRTRTYTHKVGTTTVHTRAETGSLTGQSESRSVVVSVSGWANTTQSGTGSWSPVPSSQTSNFTQTQGYTQNQSRTWTYKVGTSTIATRSETRALSNQSRSRTVTVAAGAYGAYGAAHSWGASWSPSYGSQTANYSQTKGYKKTRSRTWTYKDGSTLLHSRNESQTTDFTSTRTIAVSFSGWSNTTRTCGAWTPDEDNYYTDQTVNQSRSCTQNLSGTYTHKSGTTTVHTRAVTNAVAQTDTRTVNGTKAIYTTGQSTSCSAWTQYSYNSPGAYSPTKESRGYSTANYTQTRNTSTPQDRTCTVTQYNNRTGNNDFVSSNRETRNLAGTESRLITVTATSWVNNGSPSNYGTWTTSGAPAGQERRSYTQPKKRTITHWAGSTKYHVVGQFNNATLYEYRTAGPTCFYDANNYIEEYHSDHSEYGEYEEDYEEITYVRNGVTKYYYQRESSNRSGAWESSVEETGSRAGYTYGAEMSFDYYGSQFGTTEIAKYKICE